MDSNTKVSIIREKRLLLALVPFGMWSVLLLLIWPWLQDFFIRGSTFTWIAHINAMIWWIVLLWSLHNLVFQIAALLSDPTKATSARILSPSIAILYTTCDDFNAANCLSCINQDYPKFHVYVCDDSTLLDYKSEIENFCAGKGKKKSTHITRANKNGFKAGNLNHAMNTFVTEEWILLVDSDQSLPRDFLSRLIKSLPRNEPNLAFMQTKHEPTIDGSNLFQRTMSQEIKLFYSRDLVLRQSFGFLPVLGHGTLIKKTALEKVGGFPEVVSEDFAFALRAAGLGLRGFYTENAVSYENYPIDFGGFMVRLKKFSGGTAEIFRREMLTFLQSSASLAEKWDLFMQLAWYVLMPIIVINGFVSAYVVNRLWEQSVPYLHPILPYLYTVILIGLLSITLSVSDRIFSALKFYFWSTAIYASAMPLAGLSFLKHLFIKPTFKRTPKNNERTPVNHAETVMMVIIGIIAITLSLYWRSPFSPILAGQGIAYLSYPIYHWIDGAAGNVKGSIARSLIYLPGVCMLTGLASTWLWGRF